MFNFSFFLQLLRTCLALSGGELSLLNCWPVTAPQTLQPAQPREIVWPAAPTVETILAAEDSHQSGNAATHPNQHFISKDDENKA